jgi:C-terminal processing protease CtpA/Prc
MHQIVCLQSIRSGENALCSLILFRLNDIIVSVNDMSMTDVTHNQAVEALRCAGNIVQLVSKLHH